MGLLVTGGAGYVGSHTAKLLSEAGFEPVVVDNLSTGHRHAVRWGPFVQADVGDTATLRAVFQDFRVDTVLHFAASAYVEESVRHPEKYFQNNVVQTLGLLEAMLQAGVKRIVFSSSCAVYGQVEQIPIPESHPQRPLNPYGESKLFVESVLRWYGHAHGLQWMALRYFNAAGADLMGQLGEEHDPETHLIPLAIATALGRRPFLEIYGADYATPDGTAIRDFVHVTDLAAAHLRAVQHLESGGESGIVNLGTSRGYSVRAVIEAVEAASGRALQLRERDRRAGDPSILVADASRATGVLHWAPNHSSLETIVGSAWRWFAGAAERAV